MDPYSLDFGDRTLVASGPLSLVSKLYHIPGAVQSGADVLLPVARVSFLAAEAVGVAEVSDAYREARRAFLRPSRDQLRAVETGFRETADGSVPSLLVHQWEFLAHSVGHREAFNGSEQGLGKTRMALALLRLWGSRRTLLVLPRDLASTWEGEIPFIWPRITDRPRFINLTEGSIEERAERVRAELPRGDFRSAHPKIIAVNYDVIADHKAKPGGVLQGGLERYLGALGSDAIVADESHKLKNPKAAVTKALLRLSLGVEGRHGCKMELTGTPIGNDVGDLWSQMRFLSLDLARENYGGWLMRFAVMRPLHLPGRTIMEPVGVSDPAALMERVERVWFRATKATCLTLPPQRREVVELDMPATTRTLYKRVDDEGEAALGHDLSLAPEAVIRIRLQQICGGHRPIPVEKLRGVGIDQVEEIAWEANPLPNCPKLQWCLDHASNRLLPHPQTRAVFWCRFNPEVDRLTAELTRLLGDGRVFSAKGGGSVRDLDEAKASFQSRDPEGVQVIVAQIARLHSGHNLQAADWMVYYSDTWSLIHHDQSEDRAHRVGRTEAVDYRYLVLRNSIDEEVRAALVSKRDFSARLTPDVATPRR